MQKSGLKNKKLDPLSAVAVVMTALFVCFFGLYLSGDSKQKKKRTVKAPQRVSPQAPLRPVALTGVREALQEAVGAQKQIRVERGGKEHQVVVRFEVKESFEPGKLAMAKDLWPLLKRLGEVIAEMDQSIQIHGHADRSEVQVAGVPDTWTLSFQRAKWVLDFWKSHFDLDPARFQLVGFSTYRPLPEEVQWAQGNSRRVEFLIQTEMGGR